MKIGYGPIRTVKVFIFLVNYNIHHIFTNANSRKWNFENQVVTIFEFYEIIISNEFWWKIIYFLRKNKKQKRRGPFLLYSIPKKRCNDSDFILCNTAYFHYDGTYLFLHVPNVPLTFAFGPIKWHLFVWQRLLYDWMTKSNFESRCKLSLF